MNIELIVIIAIVVAAGAWVIRRYIKGIKAKSCACGCSCDKNNCNDSESSKKR